MTSARTRETCPDCRHRPVMIERAGEFGLRAIAVNAWRCARCNGSGAVLYTNGFVPRVLLSSEESTERLVQHLDYPRWVREYVTTGRSQVFFPLGDATWWNERRDAWIHQHRNGNGGPPGK